MSNIIPSDPRRSGFVAGLRELADWLEVTPDAPTPFIAATGHRLNVPLNTNKHVEEVATAHGLEIVTDTEGNMSCDAKFGLVTWHMYGYTDFAEHCDRTAERDAREWAEREGLEIVKPIVSDDTIRQADNLLALNIADREAVEGGAA